MLTRWRATDWRTVLAGIDPGLTRLRLALIAVASVMLAAGVTELLRLTLARGVPVTVLLFAGALAMISNLAVNEPDLSRRRVTTALLVLPALASVAAGTLLSSYRIVADVVFVLVMMGAVWIRRYGPRGFSLGMAAFMPFFFTQFLAAKPAQLPWLLVAVVTGLASTLLLRGVVFAERPERTLRRLVSATRARAYRVVLTTDAVLAELATPEGPGEAQIVAMRRARSGLNETAMLVEDQLEQTTAGRVWPGLDDDTLALRMFDTELALERLAVSTRRLARPPDHNATDDDGTDQRPDALAITALRAGLARLAAALEAGAGHDEILIACADARGAVAGLVADTRPGPERVQRTAFAVRRVADAVTHAQRDAPARRRAQTRHPHADTEHDDIQHDDTQHDDLRRLGRPELDVAGSTDHTGKREPGSGADVRAGSDVRAAGAGSEPETRDHEDDDPRDTPGGLPLSTRQALQVGVGTTLAIVVGELISTQRWYWAVITAFVVFANTESRGDLLGRSWGRILGTVLGVAAGMLLAALVGGHQILSLVLLFSCLFLALYLVRLSPALLAFWITAVLALVYGLIGQFSVSVLLLRIEETVVGALASVVAAFLVLPRGTRAAFGEAVDELAEVMDDVLGDAVDRLCGHVMVGDVIDRARDMDAALETLRQRTRPLTVPGLRRRGRSSYQRGLRTLVICDHYVRALVRLAGNAADRTWEPTLRPAADQVRFNLDALRDVLARGRRRTDGGQVLARSAESVVDAAEAHAARTEDPSRRLDRLAAARLLRRVDQAVVGLAVDLGAADDTEQTDQDPRTSSSAGLANTRSGS